MVYFPFLTLISTLKLDWLKMYKSCFFALCDIFDKMIFKFHFQKNDTVYV